MKEHKYTQLVTWTGNLGEGTLTYQSYSRDFRIQIEGKSDINGSADTAFRGDPSKYNPEDMLVSAIATCHMLWYLHLCADNEIVVNSYEDMPVGIMENKPGAGGKFTSVVLHPRISITDNSKNELAVSLHKEAGAKCFITNSCNFPVIYEPLIV